MNPITCGQRIRKHPTGKSGGIRPGNPRYPGKTRRLKSNPVHWFLSDSTGGHNEVRGTYEDHRTITALGTRVYPEGDRGERQLLEDYGGRAAEAAEGNRPVIRNG